MILTKHLLAGMIQLLLHFNKKKSALDVMRLAYEDKRDFF